MPMLLAFKYRLRPSKRQHAALRDTLESQRQLYNAALEERIGCYRRSGKGRSYIDQFRSLTEWRQQDAEAAAVPLKLQRWTLKRLDEAYQAFFRRLKARDGKAGFPRFRGKQRWDSFGFAEFSGIRWDGRRLRWRGMPGGLRVHLHRPLPAGADIRSCVFRRDHKGWAVCFQISVPVAETRGPTRAIGIDLGLKVFAYCSDGATIPAPQIARRAQRQMRLRQRALARCKRGSNRRRKVGAQFARAHAKIANARNTWLHQQSAALVNRADLIAVEKLRIKGLAGGMLAKSVSDAGWGKFIGMLRYKAARAGSHIVEVDPRHTSQECSGCGVLVPKTLAQRTHHCPACGLVLDRDENAARNILARGVVVAGQRNVARWGERAAGNLSLISS